MSVARCQREVSSAEFAEWIAYYTVEPFGEQRADLRSAIIATVIANVNRGKGQRPFKTDDFMPDFGKPDKRKQSDEQIAATFTAFIEQHNAAQRRRG